MADFKNKNVLILGGLGFIGSNLAIRMVELGANVTLVDSMLPKFGGNLANVEPIKDMVKINFSDIRDEYSIDYLIRDVDIIYCVAGQTSHIESMNNPIEDMKINCSSQLSILERCRYSNPGVIIVYASTRQIYGRPQFLPVDENHPTVPADVNGINKLAAENYYTLYSKVYGIKCISLRLTNTYGPRQHLHGNKQGFVGIFIRLAIDGKTIKIFGDGTQLRDFNYIDDVVNAFVVATFQEQLYGKTFNLGANTYYSLLDFVKILKKYCDFEYTLVPFPPKHAAIDIGDFYSSYSLFKSLTGWTPKIDLEEGLKKTVEYFRPRAKQYW
jgi:nucleoside-diphosphate-sugar epimerase